MKNILIVDDHSIVITGMKVNLIQKYSFCNVESAQHLNDVLEKLKTTEFDIIILDVNMPGLDTVSLLHQILTLKPHQKVLIFSMNSEEVYAKRFLKLGARGYLSKEASREDILKAIQTIIDGRIYISDKVMQKISNQVINSTPDNLFDLLSERELEVARYLGKGMKLFEICELLNLHPSTIGTHKSRIFDKLGVKNIVELRELAQLNNIIF